MSKIAPIFPTTLEELKSNPAIIEHWPHISRLVTGHLLTLLHIGALQGKEANTAEHAVGAQFAIGKILDHLSQLGAPAAPPLKATRIAPLHRFSENQPGENTTPAPEK